MRQHNSSNRSQMVQRRQAGLSLVELMVAMVIGLLLLIGATQVYINGHAAYDANESVSRMQETARYAMSILEPDIRMSNYWGLVKGAASIVSGQSPQTATSSPNWAGLTACGKNFATDLNTNLQADDNSYLLTWDGSATAHAACNSLSTTDAPSVVWNTSPMLSSDTLTVRRASAFTGTSTNNWLQICSSRTQGILMSTGSVCNAVSQQVNNLIVNAYYVDRNSRQQAGLPSLRRKTLISATGNQSAFFDQEVIAGVEDMQLQFGIDPLGTGVAARYVNPTDLKAALAANGQVVAVRVWLMVRSDTPEYGFTDTNTYTYADRQVANGTAGDLSVAGAATKAFKPSAVADTGLNSVMHYRRLLISRTIQVRNALGT
ncbi:MAG TPA: PilW family protein [Steroidobacteraceae bacterium]|nr:PilW family protein [Steroidobacteraceae bacterium]